MILLLLLFGSALASEPVYPLWDGHESVADYANRANLPPTKTLDLGNGVKLDLVLIPAGKFIMGTPEPTQVDEEGFEKRIVMSQMLVAANATALIVMVLVVAIRAIRKRRRPQLSLGRLSLITLATGGCVLSGLHWRRSTKELGEAHAEYASAMDRYEYADQSEKPAHFVTLTKPFYMGKFAVTQEQYQAVTGQLPSSIKGKDNPVEMVPKSDAQECCNKLTEKSKQSVRLPTEAEWEFACRAGTTAKYYSGDTDADLARVAWYWGNSNGTTHPVGQKEPNAFGLFDMEGNVGQWCADRWDENYYSKSPAENPEGAAGGDNGVLRGGAWDGLPKYCRSASRLRYSQDSRGSIAGFRVVVSVPKVP